MITSTSWVPRGFAAEFPNRKTFDEDEFERIAEIAQLKLDDAEEDLEEAQAAQLDDEDESGTNGAANGGGVSLAMDIDEEPSKKNEKPKKKKKKSKQDDEDADDDLKEYNLDTYDDDQEADGDDAQSMFRKQ
ncbi:hypothetical protein ABW20_dc0100993 [Dactylellina cionopaga]|nr:hypothetical protein ABW20_dc0100993 [Dactylellina cionopaga]